MKLVVLVVFCAVIATTQSDNRYGRPNGQYMNGYKRAKPLKYSSAPQRFYNRPQPSFPSHGAFYTPAPGYIMNNDEPPYPGNPGNLYPGNSRAKVSKMPTNEDLGDDGLQNFVKYLSKQDLDKIIEYDGHNRDRERFREDNKKYADYRPTTDEYRNVYNNIQDSETFSKPDDDSNIFSALVKEIYLDPKSNSHREENLSNKYNNLLENYETDTKPFYKEYNGIQKPYNEYSGSEGTYVTAPTLPSLYDPQNLYNNAPLDTQESMPRQVTYSNTPNNGILTESEVITEDILPRPLNLRDDQDFDVSFTHNVPKVVRADSSYKLENFGELPLMGYNSKLDTVSSYHVPHYTVTSSSSLSSNANPSSSYSAKSSSYSSSVPVEPAPPPSAAKEQSDAHLKAVRIWSHKSQGTAYTLYDDGTLSLEKPGRPKYGYS